MRRRGFGRPAILAAIGLVRFAGVGLMGQAARERLRKGTLRVAHRSL